MMTQRDGQDSVRSGAAAHVGGLGADGLRAIEGAMVMAQVSDLLAVSAPQLTPCEVLSAVCGMVASHLSLAGAVFFKRIGGRSSSLVWNARGVTAERRMAARESAWTIAHALLTGAPPEPVDARAASASLRDEQLALSAMLYVESHRPLDELDRDLLRSLLHRMVCAPGGYEG
jgi:hypothetical protein